VLYLDCSAHTQSKLFDRSALIGETTQIESVAFNVEYYRYGGSAQLSYPLQARS
jgi:hypothetical protein